MLGAVERAVGLAKGILLGKVRATKLFGWRAWGRSFCLAGVANRSLFWASQTRLQLWGAALPITRTPPRWIWRVSFVHWFDPAAAGWASRDAVDFAWSACHRIGIAGVSDHALSCVGSLQQNPTVGDWLSATPARASTIEAAWLSGVRLAEHIAAWPNRALRDEACGRVGSVIFEVFLPSGLQARAGEEESPFRVFTLDCMRFSTCRCSVEGCL